MPKFEINHVHASGRACGTIDGDQTGSLRHPVEGQPLKTGEKLVRVTSVDEDGTMELETLYEHGGGHDGPARVSNKRYRDGYDAIFGKKTDTTMN